MNEVNEEGTTLLFLLHGSREVSQLFQAERQAPNCCGGVESWIQNVDTGKEKHNEA